MKLHCRSEPDFESCRGHMRFLQALCTISFLFMTFGGGFFCLLHWGFFNLHIDWNLCLKLLELIPSESSA